MELGLNPKANLISFVALLIVFVLIDVFWNLILSRPLWESQIRLISGKELDIDGWAAIVAYLLIVLGLNYLAYGQINTANRAQSAAFLGALYGLIIHGFYNMTTLAMFSNYNPALALIDTLWGMLASGLTLYIVSSVLL